MPEVARATVTIIPNMQGSQKKIAEDLDASSGKVGESAGKKLGLKLISGIGAIGVTAAVTKLVKDSIDQGAKLQQSFGGLDTLYGDASEAAKKYAKEAYSAGISANDYAEQAVSFGASLKKAFGGDTAKAAEAANTAIMDMADNAAKMGTPLESIQNAYQGFAKGQYNMLDNLKLGYGGTKTEMERLLADASKLSGVDYNIDNLGDVYDAIHVIQEDLGLTGVAAEEAATTFSGSFGAMKAAVTNLLADMSLGNDISQDLDALGSSIKTFLVGNLLPMIGNALASLPSILAELPGFIADLLPDLLSGAVDVVVQLAQAIVSNLPAFIDGIGELLTAIPEALTNIDWAETASTLLSGLSASMEGIWDSIVNLFKVQFGIDLPDWETVKADIEAVWNNVKEGITDFFKTAFEIIADDEKTPIEKIKELWNLVSGKIGDLFKGYFTVVTGGWEAVAKVISNWWGKNIWPKIQDFFKTTFGVDVPKWSEITQPIVKLWNTVKEYISNFFQHPFEVRIPTFGEIFEKIDSLWSSIWNGITGFFNTTFHLDIPTWEDVKLKIINFWHNIENNVREWFKSTFNVDVPEVDEIVKKIRTFWHSVRSGITTFFKKIFNVDTPNAEGLKERIGNFWDNVKEKLGDLISILSEIKLPKLEDIVKDIKDLWDNVKKGVGDFLTLDWLFGSKTEEQAIEEMGGKGRKFDVNGDSVNIDSDSIQQALDSANLKLSDIDTSSIKTAKDKVEKAISQMETKFSEAKFALPAVKTASLTLAKSAVNGAVTAFKKSMRFTWNLPSLHGHLPIISVTMKQASSSDGKTKVSYPDLNVTGTRWFAKGGIFNDPTIIGIGDSKGPEAAVPLDEMWKRMSREFDEHANGAQVTNYFTVDGSRDPELWAQEVARTIKRELRMA